MSEKLKRVVIVGAGMAGLTAAAYLARKNYEVLLLEKNDRTGGLLNTLSYNDFSFDTGPRALVNSGIVKPILKELGIDWEFIENRISIGLEDKLFQVNSIDDLQEYQRTLCELYPQNTDEIKKIFSFIREMSEYTRVIYEFDNPYFSDQMNDREYVLKKLLPWTFKFLKSLSKFNQYKMPMEEFLQGFTQNQSIIDILIQHFFRGTPTYFALGYFYVYLDYFYPRGGTSALSNLIREKVLQWGGKIQLSTQITEVVPSESRIIDSAGNSYDYDHLIWAADLKTFYHNLNQTKLDQQTIQKIEHEKGRILLSKGAESVFILYLAVDRPPSYFKEKGGEHMFFTPSRQGLGETNSKDRVRLIEEFDRVPKSEIIEWLDNYCDLNTFEVSIPVLRDPSLAPEGQTGLMISCLFDYQLIKKVESAGWYDEFKERVENRIISVFSRSIFPDLDHDILSKFSATPLTINKVAGSSEGAITGWSFETEPPVIHKLTDVGKSVITPIPNIYQAGQWAYAPAGVPIAMLTAWHAYQKILKRSKKK